MVKDKLTTAQNPNNLSSAKKANDMSTQSAVSVGLLLTLSSRADVQKVVEEEWGAQVQSVGGSREHLDVY